MACDRRTLLLAGVMALALAAAPAFAQESKSPIAVIGGGNIGGTIGGLWVKAGHPVMFASRHPEDLKPLVEKLGPLAKAGTVEQALAFGDAVLIAVPYKAYPDLGKTYGAALKGKVVLDAGNATQARDGELAAEAESAGIGATSAKYLPGARLVRAFNAANYRLFAQNAHRSGAPMAVPIAGDNKQALSVAATLVRDAGFEPVVVGGLDAARKFQMGSPGFQRDATGPEARKAFGVTE
ncbi:NADPH-dependent F420 reductase [Methylobacterium sp. SyP6R]|uniref:NADPH-dependent F420 reductase n=1 Tax=Methylobacterium sp. SyP6R TaxID=2718876 RepID=UPI001F450477|nr:NAD(P)-binding domain-containing protein [Methylobacterium sp. SyP6R]MCF4126221.1 NAD(P)-binding domain-containing protein [Methylobacterium sp. SyP6R]